MAYMEYRCKHCGKVDYFFEQEVDFNFLNTANHKYEKMPPNPVIIHTTDCFMSEPILDSMETARELDRILTMEARIERETKLLDRIRRNI